jgi:hypothetical protein
MLMIESWINDLLITFFAEEKCQVVARWICPEESSRFDRQATAGPTGMSLFPVDERVDSVTVEKNYQKVLDIDKKYLNSTLY